MAFSEPSKTGTISPLSSASGYSIQSGAIRTTKTTSAAAKMSQSRCDGRSILRRSAGSRQKVTLSAGNKMLASATPASVPVTSRSGFAGS